jgi:hypothetical protein
VTPHNFARSLGRQGSPAWFSRLEASRLAAREAAVQEATEAVAMERRYETSKAPVKVLQFFW